MGFWKGLGKGLLGAGGVIAAPFTGGASLATVIPAILGSAGAVASGISSRRIAGRLLENQNTLDFLRAPGMNARNSVQGDLLANAQRARVTGPITGTRGNIPQITGGLSPALYSQNTRQLGADMSRRALMQQMKGGTEPAKGNALDAILSGIGYAGLGADLLGKYGPQSKPQIPQIPMTGTGIPGIPFNQRPRY